MHANAISILRNDVIQFINTDLINLYFMFTSERPFTKFRIHINLLHVIFIFLYPENL